MRIRKKQCRACPWKVTTDPDQDIPGGYCRDKHRNLDRTIADGDNVEAQVSDLMPGHTLRLMACHESTGGDEFPCVGWLDNQLGPGNNLALRMLARDGRFSGLELDGDQHERLEDTIGGER